MAAKPLPDAELLRKLLRYDPETGKLYWRERTPDMFEGKRRSAKALCAAWNSKNAANEAFKGLGAQGYGTGTLLGAKVRSHRVIWKMVTGEDPAILDHINGKRSDNRWCNLRDGTKLDNAKNSRRRSDNGSGCTGVSFCKQVGRWRATIWQNGKQISLGRHETLEDAVRARKAAERRLEFHPNHGRYA